MSTNQHLVSIVMPCYNAGLYLAQALKAVSEQTYVNWEVIAIDDCGPKDGTEAIVLAFAQKYGTDRVRFIKHEDNKGVSAARNTGIKNAKGTFIALLDPDDVWMPNHIQTAVEKFKNDDQLYFYSSFAHLFKDDNISNIIGIEGYKDWELSITPFMLCVINSIPNSSAVLRKTVFDLVGLYDETEAIQHSEDYDLWVRIVKNNLKLFINKEPTIYYRKHSLAATANRDYMLTVKKTFTDKHKDWLFSYQQLALANFRDKIIALEHHNADLNAYNTKLAIRLEIIENTINKVKSLPVLKQLFALKKHFKA